MMCPTDCSLDFGFSGLQCLLDNRPQIWLMPLPYLSFVLFVPGKTWQMKSFHAPPSLCIGKSSLQIEMIKSHLLENPAGIVLTCTPCNVHGVQLNHWHLPLVNTEQFSTTCHVWWKTTWTPVTPGGQFLVPFPCFLSHCFGGAHACGYSCQGQRESVVGDGYVTS